MIICVTRVSCLTQWVYIGRTSTYPVLQSMALANVKEARGADIVHSVTNRLDWKGDHAWEDRIYQPWWVAQDSDNSRPISGVSFKKLVGQRMAWHQRTCVKLRHIISNIPYISKV